METRFEELKRYVRLTAEDALLLGALRPLAAPHFERIIEEFYERLREHEAAHAVFADEPRRGRLQRSLVRWLGRFFSGTYDEAYFQKTVRIGRVHVRAGLPQRYVFTAMALIRVALTRIADEKGGPEAPAIRDATTKLLDLELAILLETYRESEVTGLLRKDEPKIQLQPRASAGQRYVSAVELAPVLIVGVDRQGRIRLFNREAERVTGFERDEILGAPFAESLLPEEMLCAHGAQIRQIAAGLQAATEIPDGTVRTRARKVRDVHWHMAFAPEASDDVVLFAMGKDTTDERRVLEHARQHEKLAAVGTLAAGLAHEIRNPLNGAQLHVAFLERSLGRSRADPEVLEAIEVVGGEFKRLARLVTEFLEFARPSPLVLDNVSVHEICRRTEARLAARARYSNIQLATDLPIEQLGLRADASKLEQVLLNVVQNAIEATPCGGTVVVRAHRTPRHAVIEVEDDGPGLGDLEAPIFDAFYTTKPSGTGLGLAIVFRIVTDHRGIIAVESRPGRTCFRITLPLEQ